MTSRYTVAMNRFVAALGICICVSATVALMSCLGTADPGATTAPATTTHPGGSRSGGGTETAGGESPAPPVEPVDYLQRVATRADWDRLRARPASHAMARTETVKFIVDTEHVRWGHPEQDAEANAEEEAVGVFFTQSETWDLHYRFVRRFIDPSVNHERFNIAQYRRPERRYILGSLMHYVDGDHWTMELVAGDTLSGERILQTFEHLRALLFFGDQLAFRPLSPLHERNIAALGDRLPVLDSDAVHASVIYQPLVNGEAFGTLRLLRGPLDIASISPTDIIVADHVPPEIPPIAALVTARLQAPLAHVAVLSRNRNTPDMALRGAHDDARFAALQGQLVRLVVGPQDFSLRRADRQEAERAWARRRPARPFRPQANVEVTRLRDICDNDPVAATYMGEKAAQLGVVCAAGIETPGGFAVPFAYYSRHFGAALPPGLIDRISTEDFAADGQVRARTLAEIRSHMMRATVDRTLVRAVRDRMRRMSRRSRFIFRSSTNAEDLPGFNGAGLYESVVVDAGAGEREIAAALRQVWASVWLQRAYEERQWYRIEHRDVAMAVLIQPFVDHVVGNGVAVTRNPFDQARPGVFINAQTGAGSVTAAGNDELPEQYLVYTWAEDYEPELLGRSSLTDGAPILTEVDALALAHILVRIDGLMVPSSAGAGTNAMDVEFLLTGDDAPGGRRFVIVQSRPIRIRYGDGQTWR